MYLPSSMFGKCPDLKIDGVFYEHEGFVTNNPKRALKNMLNRGLEQCDKLIIDKPNLTDRFIRRIISNHIIEGQIIKEIWVREDSGELILFYKKTDG